MMVEACRFPLWEHGERPTHKYCGKVPKVDSPYCDHHHEKAHVKNHKKTKTHRIRLLKSQGMDNKQIAIECDTSPEYVRAVISRTDQSWWS